MYTLNQILNKLQTISTDHKQINYFGNGDLWELVENNTISGITYPMMWATIGSANIVGKTLFQSISLYFCDLVNKDESNENEVLSDMQLVALDVLALLQDSTDYDNFMVDISATLQPFTERFEDELSGWVMDIQFKQSYTSDQCQVPTN